MSCISLSDFWTKLEEGEGASFPVPKSPPSGRAARPLPRPPVNGSTSSFGSASPSIPEPQPYVHASSSSQPDSYQRSSTGSSTSFSRRLPHAPEAGIPVYKPEASLGRTLSSTSTESRSFGLPSNPRPPRPPVPPSGASYASTSSATSSLHPYTTATPISDSPSTKSPSPGWSNPSDTRTYRNGNSVTLSRADSSRPKGALAPAVPGQSSASLNGGPLSASSAGSSADAYASTHVRLQNQILFGSSS